MSVKENDAKKQLMCEGMEKFCEEQLSLETFFQLSQKQLNILVFHYRADPAVLPSGFKLNTQTLQVDIS